MKMINRPHPEANRELVEALRAALAAPVAAPVAMWQPIKTAPKDGAHILARLPDSDTCYVVCWSDASLGIRKELGDEVGWRIAYCGDLVGGASAPTHWMPLPDSSASAARPADDELWDKTLKERDDYHEWADKLAAAIAEHTGVDIGEHSSANNPWHEAIEALGAAQSVSEPVAVIEHTVGGSLRMSSLNAGWNLPMGVEYPLYLAAPTAQPEPITGWRVIGPDGSVFEDETPFKAAVLANRHRVKVDPAVAKQFTDAIDEMAREGEAENARLIAEHGSLDCPACGGSGHVGDVAEPSDEAIEALVLRQTEVKESRPFALLEFARAVLALRGTTK